MIGQAMGLSSNKQFAAQIARLPHELQMLLQPMFAAYDKRVSELQRERSRDQEALQEAQSELRELQASVKEVVGENESLRRELQEATHKLLQETTRGSASPGPASPGVSADVAGETRQELETMVQLLRSENNVVLSQRRSLAEEAQALKVHRDRIEEQLKQAQDELAATRGSMQELTSRLQETESECTRPFVALACAPPNRFDDGTCSLISAAKLPCH
jgi:predicted  nucleic acid-binding Zn-ribbon protein